MDIRTDGSLRLAASRVSGRASSGAAPAVQADREDGRWTIRVHDLRPRGFGPALVLIGCVAYALFVATWLHANSGVNALPIDWTQALVKGTSDVVLWIPAATALAHVIHYARRIRSLEAALTHERLTVLSMELRPHFLLNALDTAAELVHHDPDAADRMLTALGHLLWHAERDGRRHEVPLSRELELTQRYVEVERARFGGRLTIESAVARDALAVNVPPFLLQPLVENALCRGIAARALRGTIRIVARRDGAMLRLDVIDDAIGFQTPSGSRPEESGVGIANVRARLRELHGARQSVDITSQSGRGTTVTVRLPWRGSGQSV